jgi:hypothetical protein
MLTKSVFQFLMIAESMLRMENVLNASKDMTSKKDVVSFPPQIMLNLQIWDAELGIGTNKSA